MSRIYVNTKRPKNRLVLVRFERSERITPVVKVLLQLGAAGNQALAKAYVAGDSLLRGRVLDGLSATLPGQDGLEAEPARDLSLVPANPEVLARAILFHGEPNQRERAAGLVVAFGPAAAQALPALSNAYQQAEPTKRLRVSIVSAVGRIRSPAAAAFLVNVLADGTLSERSAAAYAFVYLGEQARSATAAIWTAFESAEDFMIVKLARALAAVAEGRALSMEQLIALITVRDLAPMKFAARELARRGADARAAAPALQQAQAWTETQVKMLRDKELKAMRTVKSTYVRGKLVKVERGVGEEEIRKERVAMEALLSAIVTAVAGVGENK